jgi:ABC-type lipoprotein release transport system permease subunit
MGFYLKLAWRNVFRNRRRTFLTGLIIGVGLAAMIFMDAWVMGMKENIIASATSSFIGQAQIHRKGYQESQENNLTIQGLGTIVSMLEEDPHVKNFTERAMSFGTVSSPSDIGSIVLYGIDPVKEKPLSKIDEAIISGAYLQAGPSGTNGVLIGADLADTLEVAVGDRIVITVARAGSGELSQNLFRVSGIFKMHIEELDSSVALIPLATAQRMIGLNGQVHEIAIQFTGIQYATLSGAEFSAKYSLPGDTAETWQELVPQIKAILQMTSISIGVTVIIVFAIIIFGILNTLFMSLYERIFEFGVLRAVGTRPAMMRNLIVIEAGILALYSILLGMALGAVLTTIGSIFGMDLTGVELSGATFTGKIYTVFALRQYLLYPAFIFGFTVLVSLFPARFASRMSITKALRRTL